jgi:hypothetical protein
MYKNGANTLVLAPGGSDRTRQEHEGQEDHREITTNKYSDLSLTDREQEKLCGGDANGRRCIGFLFLPLVLLFLFLVIMVIAGCPPPRPRQEEEGHDDHRFFDHSNPERG